jgi:hypothetical protein
MGDMSGFDPAKWVNPEGIPSGSPWSGPTRAWSPERGNGLALHVLRRL